MNTERAILKGKLADLKMRKMELDTAISGNVKAAKALLAGAAVTPIARIDIEGAAANLTEAAALKKELGCVIEKIGVCEEELE